MNSHTIYHHQIFQKLVKFEILNFIDKYIITTNRNFTTSEVKQLKMHNVNNYTIYHHQMFDS